MARYTRTVTHYTFNPPREISEIEFTHYKEILLINPKADINPRIKSSLPKKILKGVGLTVLFPWALMGGAVESEINLVKVQMREKNFYTELSDLILKNQDSYEDFRKYYVALYLKYNPLGFYR